MDWSTEEVVQWLKDIGLSKYTKRFKGYSITGAVLIQMDETLLDDLEVTDAKDREILLSETEKLSSPKMDDSQFLSTKNKPQPSVKNSHVLQTPVITVSDFDDEDDNEHILGTSSDDEEVTNNQRARSNAELLNQRIINLAYSGDESTTDDGSERDFSFKDSDEEHDFDIYDEDKEATADFSPEVSAVASRATKMVELLSRDNVALREKLESLYLKMNSMQMLECELESMRSAYDELQISCRKRETMEWNARVKMETEIGKLQKNNKQLQDELEKYKDGIQQEKKSLEKCRSDLHLKNNVIRQLISQSNSFASTREDLENTINQQRRQIEELLNDKEQLHLSLVESRERTTYLEKELYKNHLSPSRKAYAQRVIQRGSAIADTCSTTDEQTTNRRRSYSYSADEGVAELDGLTSVPVLLEMLKEKDERIQVLGEQLLRLEQTLQQEGTSRNLAIRAVSMPKEARIAALEKSIQESEKIIAECRGQHLRSIEELYVANRRCADLEAIIKSLHSQLSEKSARLRILENNNDGDDEPKEPEWPLDPAFCRTDFAHMKDLARDSYAESFDSGMSLTNTIDMKHTDPEFKTMDEPDQVSVHVWSV